MPVAELSKPLKSALCPALSQCSICCSPERDVMDTSRPRKSVCFFRYPERSILTIWSKSGEKKTLRNSCINCSCKSLIVESLRLIWLWISEDIPLVLNIRDSVSSLFHCRDCINSFAFWRFILSSKFSKMISSFWSVESVMPVSAKFGVGARSSVSTARLGSWVERSGLEEVELLTVCLSLCIFLR